MEAPPETFGSLELTDSIEVVEFDTKRELFHTTFDSDRDSISLVVTAVVASIANQPSHKLDQLHSVIDTDALENLFQKPDKGTEGQVIATFFYEGFEVTVFGEGRIEVDQVREDTIRIDDFATN